MINAKKSKKFNINLLYEVPSNQTPDELARIDTSLVSLKQEIQKLQEILELQENKIGRISDEILQSQQENFIIRSEISKVKMRKKTLSGDAGMEKNEKGFVNAEEKVIKAKGEFGGFDMKRIEKLTRILKRNDEDIEMLDKRLKAAETLLGLRIN
jgi:hypothetical protein